MTDNPYTPPPPGADEPIATQAELDEDSYPDMHRGHRVLTLGICGFAICFVCGIIAWVMGSGDLKEMDSGLMDASGRGLTRAGMILGMISTFLAGIWQIGYLIIILADL